MKALPPLEAVLVNPMVHASTPEVFKALSNKNNAPMPEDIPNFESARVFAHWLAGMRNDLEVSAMRIVPQIDEVLRALSAQSGCMLARMSGSGSTCFGLFDNHGLADIAVKELSELHPDWWVQDCRLS